MSKKRKWSAEVKFEIVLLTLKGDCTLAEICKRYEVAPSQVHLWKNQFLQQGAQVFSKGDKAAVSALADAESTQRKLYEKIGQLTVERDFLKKSWGKLPGNGDNS